jgi:hypothetical protein
MRKERKEKKDPKRVNRTLCQMSRAIQARRNRMDGLAAYLTFFASLNLNFNLKRFKKFGTSLKRNKL